MPVGRYAEVIGAATEGTDILTGTSICLDRDIRLQPRQTLVVAY